MRREKRECRPAAVDFRFQIGFAADALAVADARLVDAEQNERRLSGNPVQELINSRGGALRTFDRVAAQPGNEQASGIAAGIHGRRRCAKREARPPR